MPIPTLTHLQFAVLDALGAQERVGRELRAGLRKRGVKKSGPAFYQLMARLEDAKFVAGRYTQKIVDGQIIKERRYKILGKGQTAWQRTRDFYLRSNAVLPEAIS